MGMVRYQERVQTSAQSDWLATVCTADALQSAMLRQQRPWHIWDAIRTAVLTAEPDHRVGGAHDMLAIANVFGWDMSYAMILDAVVQSWPLTDSTCGAWVTEQLRQHPDPQSGDAYVLHLLHVLVTQPDIDQTLRGWQNTMHVRTIVASHIGSVGITTDDALPAPDDLSYLIRLTQTTMPPLDHPAQRTHQTVADAIYLFAGWCAGAWDTAICTRMIRAWVTPALRLDAWRWETLQAVVSNRSGVFGNQREVSA